jgi:hypothetical protein
VRELTFQGKGGRLAAFFMFGGWTLSHKNGSHENWPGMYARLGFQHDPLEPLEIPEDFS